MTLVRVRMVAEVPVAGLPADVAVENADTIHAELVRSISNRADGLILDLQETRYLDSAGIEMLFTLRHELADRRQRLVIVAPAESPPRRLLELAGVTKVVAVTEDTADAILAISDPSVAQPPS